MAVSDVSERCSRHDLRSKPLLVGLLFVSVPSFSSAIGNGVDLASVAADGIGVGSTDLLESCLHIIGDSISSGRSLNHSILFLSTPGCLG